VAEWQKASYNARILMAEVRIMLNPLWNPAQNRLRAFWRLLLEGVLYLLCHSLSLGGLWWLALLRTRLLGVGSVWLAGRVLDRRRFHDLGLHFARRWWLDLAFGLVLGALLMLLVFVVELAAGWVTITGMLRTPRGWPAFPLAMLLMLGGFVGVGIEEELFARGYLLRNLAEGLCGRWLRPQGAVLLAWLGSSVVFGLLHARNPNATLASTLALMVGGLALGLGYVLTGELAISIGMHITWNLFQGNVFGFPVSGLFVGPTIIAITQGGPALWTGGPFGPEAGIIGGVATALGVVLTLFWVRWRYGRIALCAELTTVSPSFRTQIPQIGTD
jgi:uncharacterized protein